MSATKTHNYKASFILDLRSSEDTAEKVLADITGVLTSIGASSIESEDLGVRPFARAADQRFTQGHYVEVYFDGPSATPATLKEKLRLDRRINRTFVEAL